MQYIYPNENQLLLYRNRQHYVILSYNQRRETKELFLLFLFNMYNNPPPLIIVKHYRYVIHLTVFIKSVSKISFVNLLKNKNFQTWIPNKIISFLHEMYIIEPIYS